jgi:hypothetical protein
MRPLSAAILCGALLTAAPAGAQTAPGAAPAGTVGSTATGDLPAKTGATTAVGQTKPPGDTVGDRLGTRPDLEEKSRDLDQKINRGICSGCQ